VRAGLTHGRCIGARRPGIVIFFTDHHVRHLRVYAPTRSTVMLETLAIVLIVLWALGMVSSYTMGGLIHILLVVAIVVVLLRVIQGRKVV